MCGTSNCAEDVGPKKVMSRHEIILPGDDKNEAALQGDNRKHSIHDESDDEEDITVQDFNSLKMIIGHKHRRDDQAIRLFGKTRQYR